MNEKEKVSKFNKALEIKHKIQSQKIQHLESEVIDVLHYRLTIKLIL